MLESITLHILELAYGVPAFGLLCLSGIYPHHGKAQRILRVDQSYSICFDEKQVQASLEGHSLHQQISLLSSMFPFTFATSRIWFFQQGYFYY